MHLYIFTYLLTVSALTATARYAGISFCMCIYSFLYINRNDKCIYRYTCI